MQELQKLLNLLNEYCTEEETKYKWNFVPNHLEWEACDNSECSDLLIVSKKYWFIKWLLSNDKVDLKKANNIDNWPLFDYYSDDDALTMALSINDEPLKFLESILKDDRQDVLQR